MTVDVAHLWSEVFAPELFVLVCTLLLLGVERTGSRRPLPAELPRLGVVAAAWAVAFAVYRLGPLLLAGTATWHTDLFGGVGLALGFLLIGGVWIRRDWGAHLPAFAGLLVVTTVAHTIVTPFWDVSSHVLYTTVPAGHLASVEHRYLPLLVVPLGMVASRPLVGAHTWAQSVAGAVLGVCFLVGFVRWRGRRGTRSG